MSEYGIMQDEISAAQALANGALAEADAMRVKVDERHTALQTGEDQANAAIICARFAVQAAEKLSQRTGEAAAEAAQAARDEESAATRERIGQEGAQRYRELSERRRRAVRMALHELATFYDLEVRPPIDTAAAMLDGSATQPEARRVHALLSDYGAARAVPATLDARAELIRHGAALDQALDRARHASTLRPALDPANLAGEYMALAGAALDVVRALTNLDIAERYQ